jgi:hypothetical protein
MVQVRPRSASQSWLGGLYLVLLSGCSRPEAAAPGSPVVSAFPPASSSVVPEPAAAPEPRDGSIPEVSLALASLGPPALSVAEVRTLLFPSDDPAIPPPCAEGVDAACIGCLLDARYAADPQARGVARGLFDATGDVAGLLPAQQMEGGFRGTLSLVPELPVGKRRAHLDWFARAAADYDRFFDALTEGHAERIRYRWRALGLRFMRSVNRTTPSAFALGWSIAYNVDGSLNTSADAVRELLFHEIFHLNDAAHGDWSVAALGPIFDAIEARCHASIACLTPFAPTTMKVRGGTYYAFQPNNGQAVREYAAELALRYYQEQRRLTRHETPRRPFKCGPKENAQAWQLIKDEFWGGIDATVCP